VIYRLVLQHLRRYILYDFCFSLVFFLFLDQCRCAHILIMQGVGLISSDLYHHDDVLYIGNKASFIKKKIHVFLSYADGG
jgi:hypothetical protein